MDGNCCRLPKHAFFMMQKMKRGVFNFSLHASPTPASLFHCDVFRSGNHPLAKGRLRGKYRRRV